MHPKTTCFDDTTLAAYIEGTLPPKEQAAFERHLRDHSVCRDVVAAIQQVLKKHDALPVEEAPEALMQKAVRLYPGQRDVLDLVLSLVSDTLNVVSAALDISLEAPVPVMAMRAGQARGASMVVMTKELGAITARVAVETVCRGLCTIAVMVTDRTTQAHGKDLRIELVSRGRELGSSLAEQGTVLFEEIKPGRYDIVIRDKSEVLGTLAIKIQK